MNSQLLIVAHLPSQNTRRLGDSLLNGSMESQSGHLCVHFKTALETIPEDVKTASGIILMTPENLGYMSGALKDFFDRCYYPCLDHTRGMPYGLVIRAGHDGTGTKLAVERIVRGLGWRAIAEPLICKGPWQEQFLEETFLFGQAMAAGLEAGIF